MLARAIGSPWEDKAQAMGRSRGGNTTKLRILADVLGRPAVVTSRRVTPET